MTSRRSSSAAESLLTPDNCTILFIDQQPQMAFGVASKDRQILRNNVVGLAKAGRAFKVPTILTTVAARTFGGPILSQLKDIFPEKTPIDRSTLNAWEDEAFVAAVEDTGSERLVISGLWTSVCVAFPALSALSDGYKVYIVTDACGDVDKESHERALARMMQAGAVPVTWLQVLLELQRDWARERTYEETLDIIKEHAGAYGIGVEYAEEMVERFSG
jgi:nicotinamidase-related amidase